MFLYKILRIFSIRFENPQRSQKHSSYTYPKHIDNYIKDISTYVMTKNIKMNQICRKESYVIF